MYVAAAAPSSAQQRASAAVLRGPEGTVASHLTAAALWGLRSFPANPHVTVPPRSSGRFRHIHVHHSPLHEDDVDRADGVPVTAPARTLVDCAAVVGYRGLCEMVDRALFRRLASADGVREAALRASAQPGRAGLGRLTRALEVWTPGPHPGSEAEMRLLRQLTEWGLPRPQRQLVITDVDGSFVARVDLGCPDLKVVYEYDGGEFHGPRQRTLDIARQRRLEALGWMVIRVGKADLRGGGERLLRRLQKVPALRPHMAA